MHNHVIPFIVCIVLIQHHTSIGDETFKEVVVEEAQEFETIDEQPQEIVQARPFASLCFANA